MKKGGYVFAVWIVSFTVMIVSCTSPDITNSNPSGENIICYGDSLTYGTGATSGNDYPSQLSKKISREIINAGVPGDTTGSALSRLEQDVLSRSPQIVIITLGGNDLKNKIPEEIAFQNLKTIVNSIHAQGALVVMGGVKIPFWGKGYTKSYNKLAKETGCVFIPNVFKGIMGHKKLMSDPIHPNDAGYTIMAEKFYKAIKPYL